MSLVNEMYGDYPDLKKAMNEAYYKGQIPNVPCDKELWDWIEKATKAAKLQT